jgi:hypothetical protein
MALLVACGPAIPPLPSRGGPAWLEVQSEHFTLWTDASAERGRELMRELELRHQLLGTAMKHPLSNQRAFVIALRSSRETGEYLPHDAIAFAWDARNPTRQPGILLAANNQDRDHVVSHELTHVISFGFLKHQPHWLAEGIARLVNTELTHEIAPTEARATAAAHPDDWRAWRLVERAVKDRAEAEAARARVCTLTGNEAPECARAGSPGASR